MVLSKVQRFGVRILLTLPLALTMGAPAYGNAIWDYIKQYQVGLDYTHSSDHVDASYEMPSGGVKPDNCATSSADPAHQRCSTSMLASDSSGWGIFLQQAFKRQGFFYFKPSLSFGARYLNGSMDPLEQKQEQKDGLPLRNLSFSFAALQVKPYIQLGITPAKTWPDLLLSIGPEAQVAVGKVTVNDIGENVAMASSSGGLIGGFTELELVLWRFGDGALSFYESWENLGGTSEGTKFYPKSIDGMTDFKARFSHEVDGRFYGLGFKLVLDWP